MSTEQELRIQSEAKFEAVKSFIYKLSDDYEELQDDKSFDDLEPYQKNEIKSKSDVLDMIKDFIFNNT